MQFVVDPSSPTPEVVQHLGTIMTIIDDMQDFAAFFGWGGYELFKRARRMAPGPWGPFFNGRDAIERAFQSRCLVKGGKNQKPNLEKEMRDYSYRQRRSLISTSLLGLAFPEFVALLLGGQVMLELFGYGIRLGPIMGGCHSRPRKQDDHRIHPRGRSLKD